MRTIRILTLAAAATLLTALPTAVRAEEPLRSGTITGWVYMSPAMFSGEARDCQWSEPWGVTGVPGGNPECRAWLESGCDPHLAGRDPTTTASIVDVAELADGTTERRFRWDTDPAGRGQTDWGGVVVQLWSDECVEVAGTKWRSRWDRYKDATFRFPTAVKWMTVTTNDTVGVTWTLS